jgi:hypothetical protein
MPPTTETPGSAAAQEAPQSMLEVLPQELLPVIASHCSSDRGHRMLGVSRAFREAVIRYVSTVTLNICIPWLACCTGSAARALQASH